MDTFLLSVVIPVYNEEKNISPFLKRLLPALKSYNFEVIFIDDGSKDETASEIKKSATKNPQIKLISFTRNFGHQMALTAGYQSAKGDAVVTIDVDLQDPPEIIPQMIEKWQKGAKIVYAKRKTRTGESFFKLKTAGLFYRLINFFSDTPIPQDVGDFRLIDRQVVEFINHLPEHSRFLRGLVAWGNFSTEYILFRREKRHAGQTHYPVSKMLEFALDGITSFSAKPLRLATYFGFFTSAFSILVIVVKSIQHFVFHVGDWLPGWASLFFAIVFLGGVQLITIGIIGEYVGKIYQETQKRPRFIIKEKINL